MPLGFECAAFSGQSVISKACVFSRLMGRHDEARIRAKKSDSKLAVEFSSRRKFQITRRETDRLQTPLPNGSCRGLQKRSYYCSAHVGDR
jgi:hypothetical protein